VSRVVFQQPAASVRDRIEAGRNVRARVPRLQQGRTPALNGRDPLVILAAANTRRVASLLPEKYRRMRRTAFTFFRGAAALMAWDLARLPHCGLTVQLCGDLHVRNLGAYAASDGRLVFDINDFDETMPGPWEWDVKRFATSLVLAGEEAGQAEDRQRAAVRAFVAAYRAHLRTFAEMPVAQLARHLITRGRNEPVLDAILQNARRVTPESNLKKLVVNRGGTYRFHDRRPVLAHVPRAVARTVVRALESYRDTLNASRRRTFDSYRAADVSFKLVGTGSVGTRDYVVLLFGNDARDPLFLQVKQELPSCYTPYLKGAARATHQGKRVADGQQMMQTASDPFLGYTRFDGHDYLVRQLADHKAGLDPSELTGATFPAYAALCGEVLAKGHARTGDAAMLAGYVGSSPRLDKAIARFAVAYAAQTKADYKRFVAGLRRIPASR
jgi:uncharacterized protein (DUF2252 family)